jgi:hypothetical protein
MYDIIAFFILHVQLLSSSAVPGDAFGSSVAMYGMDLIVGASAEQEAGSNGAFHEYM